MSKPYRIVYVEEQTYEAWVEADNPLMAKEEFKTLMELEAVSVSGSKLIKYECIEGDNGGH